MDELEDCAPEGTATPVYNRRIARDIRRTRLRHWLGQLLAVGRRGRARALRALALAPEAQGEEGDGAWTHANVLQRDAARPTPRRVPRLDRKRVTAGRERQSRY